MPRSLWKGPYCEVSPSQTTLYSRRSIILPEFLEKTVRVHTGKNFLPLKISEEMIGHRFGEFATTRRKARHKTKK